MHQTTGATPTVLHYTGYAVDGGGIHAIIRALAGEQRFRSILGVSPAFAQRVRSRLRLWRGPHVEGERIAPLNAWRTFGVAWRVRRWLRRGGHHVFHGHSRAGMLVGLWLTLLGQRRVVVTVHCYGRQRWFYRLATRVLGERLYWLSPAMRNYYGVTGDGWAQCIPGCVSGEFPSTKKIPPVGVVRLGGIGALVRWKNWHLVIAALASLPVAVRRRLQFHHLGGPDKTEDTRLYAAELRAQTAAEGLEATIVWHGEQPSAAAFLSKIDCLVVASHNEPFSVAMLEALQAGVPVVAADSGGAQDIVVPPRNGWLFRSGDAGDLARVLTMLVCDDGLARATIDQEGLRRFTGPVVAETYAEVYRKLA